MRCQGCGLVHADAGYPPRFLDDHYAGRAQRTGATTAIPTGPREGSERKRSALALYDRLCGGRLQPAAPEALALDIGCGQGLLLDLLREAGYHTVGIERSPAAADAQAAGHQVLAVDIEASVHRPERFALITLTHVLEHVRKPEAALRFVGEHLAPGGIAIVEVPNWGDLARPLWGPRYRPLELGDHLSFFERDTLTALVRRAGLHVHALWSAPQARTVVFPSLLSGLDVTRDLLRRRSPGPAEVGVAADRTGGGARGWRHTAVSTALGALDRLDPLLERAIGTDWAHGANLVAVLTTAPL